MTVRDLIRQLELMPAGAPVVFEDEELVPVVRTCDVINVPSAMEVAGCVLFPEGAIISRHGRGGPPGEQTEHLYYPECVLLHSKSFIA